MQKMFVKIVKFLPFLSCPNGTWGSIVKSHGIVQLMFPLSHKCIIPIGKGHLRDSGDLKIKTIHLLYIMRKSMEVCFLLLQLLQHLVNIFLMMIITLFAVLEIHVIYLLLVSYWYEFWDLSSLNRSKDIDIQDHKFLIIISNVELFNLISECTLTALSVNRNRLVNTSRVPPHTI